MALLWYKEIDWFDFVCLCLFKDEFIIEAFYFLCLKADLKFIEPLMDFESLSGFDAIEGC